MQSVFHKSVRIYFTKKTTGKNLSFSGLNLALANPNTDLRLFGKPEGFKRRRMGVATARAETADQARELALQAAQQVSVHQN